MNGITISKGIVIGTVLVKPADEIIVKQKSARNIEKEQLRLAEALDASLAQIDVIAEKERENTAGDGPLISDSHRMFLQDVEFTGKMKQYIVDHKMSAEFAVQSVSDDMIKIFQSIEDPYIRERMADIADIKRRILRNLMGIDEFHFDQLPEGTILVAPELAPSDMMQMDITKVYGCITEGGSATAHFAILAKSMGMPMLLGVKNAACKMKDGEVVVLDLDVGEVHTDCTAEQLEVWKERETAFRNDVKDMKKWIGHPSVTGDGNVVLLEANIGGPEELNAVKEGDAEGIGLFRTEFLYMNSSALPTEDEQFEVYKKVVEAMNGKAVTIRTLDIGGDKELTYYNLPKESNPFLGVRAIRLCLKDKELFRVQLRALLRAASYGNLRIMFPMISGVQELRKAKRLLSSVKKELEEQGIPYGRNVPVGIMVELPSAVMVSDLLAKECDFFSIGTNDLIQYTIGVDRTNPKVAYLYDFMHPAVLRMIDIVIKNAHAAGIPACMCGEAAAEEKLIPLLVYMGLDEYSMSANQILRVRRRISKVHKAETWKEYQNALELI
ncbi:MAG: phosphoenolpyruvate--protein phosphotransferase [Clostridiales Family XIII bacterium]|jgi:phosphotransferase system enzyme I (PtsI)|nr:phosphoenolpyruvate--protein phosphotransferase [Clostridiales Family XIII bacterium]